MIAQQQVQKQQLKILPQQIQLLNLFFLNTQELQMRIATELEQNPLLDTKDADADDLGKEKTADEVQDYQDWDEFGYDDRPDYKQEYSNYFDSEATPEKPLAAAVDFREDAKQQLMMYKVDEQEMDIAMFIIDLLNDKGMLDKTADEIADEYSFQSKVWVEAEDIKKGIALVQSLDPVGLAATSIKECLLMQLQRMNKEDRNVVLATKLVNNHYDDLLNRQFDKIHHVLRVDDEKLKEILALVAGLKFHPVCESAGSYEPRHTIMPDYIITRNGDDIHVALCSSKSDSVFVNQSLYQQLNEQCSARDKSGSQYIKSKLQSAEWFVNAVKQREDTMMRIMKCVVDLQREYFHDGDIMKLKPMVLRNIADITGLDLSTISRITSNKYAETHFGMVYLKDLFSEGIADQKGQVVSNKVIQTIIQEMISKEDKHKPYTDQQLMDILCKQGYNIARRTVAKYREQLNIPVAQIRAVWA